MQLKQRAALLPNILTIAKKFMEHESDVFTKITELRTNATSPYNPKNAGDVSKHLQAADMLDQQISKFMLNVENYPQLKSDATMVEAMNTNNELEAQISAARRFYNSAVRELNTTIQIFPGSVVASVISVQVMPYYAADEAALSEVKANDYLN